MRSWVIVMLMMLPHLNHDIPACKGNFYSAAHYSFLGKPDAEILNHSVVFFFSLDANLSWFQPNKFFFHCVI